MPFIMKAWTDGACRRNGYSDSVGGTGVWFPRYRPGNQSVPLPSHPTPTNQSLAELTAIIPALQFVHEKQVQICASAECPPFFSVTIHADSKYAVDCLNKWVLKWIQNGWRTSKNKPVANADLIEEAHNLRLKIKGSFKGGRIIFRWIPRAENGKADKFANDACDEAER
ncbi:ribonuclease H1, partial [Mycena olivaceomarginata]